MGDGDDTKPAAPLTQRPPQPRSKWTADTERAFLAALRLCGQAKQAAVEIGRNVETLRCWPS